tara:strand:- start:42 stop:200 length:159 start_codon:yes stop_codon:yes gene_type:complete
MKAGTVKNIPRIMSYNIVLGNAPKVEILVNGKPYNFDKFVDKLNVARFTIDI